MDPNDYTIYDIVSRRILRSGHRPDVEWLEGQLEEGQAIIKGEALADTEWTIISGQKVAIDRVVDLRAIALEYSASIDAQAEAVRSLFITNTPSQPAVYLMKEAEAQALVANPDTPEAETPSITLEAVRIGESRFDTAVVILTQAQAWRTVSAEIEDIRLRAKDIVRAAENREEMQQALQVDWSPITALVQT